MTVEPRDRRLAAIAIAISVIAFLAIVPFAQRPLPQIWAFIPSYQSALAISDAITATLLFAQYSTLRSRSLLALACGYLFSAMMVVPHLLTFPGLFSATGLLNAGPQSTAYLYMFWHAGFPVAVIAYALLKGRRAGDDSSRPVVTILSAILAIGVAAAALTALATAGHPLLPSIMVGNRYTFLMIYVVGTVWALSLIALIAVYRARPRSVIDLWLAVTMCAWLFDIALSAVFNAGRFDVGFYAGRMYGLLAASFVLIMLLVQTAGLYRKLLDRLADERAGRKREEERRRRFFETSLDLLMTVDRRGTFVEISPSAAAILGYRPEEMTGHTGLEFIHPDDLEATRQEMRQARRGHSVRHFECRYMHRDGHAVPLNWTGVWSDPEQMHYFIGRDMTKRRNLEGRERKAKETLAAVVDASPVAIICLSAPDRRVLVWSRAAEQIFGYAATEVIGKPYPLVPPAGAQEYEQLFERALAGEPLRDIRVKRCRKDGTLVDISFDAALMQSTDGTAAIAYALSDVTERIRLEQQLQQSQKMDAIGQLTGGIAHDFNNILTVITTTIDILGDAVADRPEIAAIAKLISEAADRGAALTGHLLAFARKQPLQPKPTRINDVLSETASLLRPTLGDGIEIESRLNADLLPALVDSAQLTTAILNLAVNARDAMPNGGKLTLETDNIILDDSYAKLHTEVAPGPYVMIAVSDTGTGIPASICEKVFEPFFTTKEVGKGTGLGLSMIYGFVKQSGGHIKIYSEEGHGTTFKIYLPQVDAELKPAPQPVPVVQTGDETILIVEDDPLVRRSVTTQLAALGYRTIVAANATEALLIVDQGRSFDLLFTDVIMSGPMNGPELAEAVAQRRGSIKVLFTSGYTENALIHRGRLAPGVLLLSKPFHTAELARMLRLALSSEPTKPAISSEVPLAIAV